LSQYSHIRDNRPGVPQRSLQSDIFIFSPWLTTLARYARQRHRACATICRPNLPCLCRSVQLLLVLVWGFLLRRKSPCSPQCRLRVCCEQQDHVSNTRSSMLDSTVWDVFGNALDRLAGLDNHEMERERKESWVESMSPMSSNQSPAVPEDLGPFSKPLLGDIPETVCGDAGIHNPLYCSSIATFCIFEHPRGSDKDLQRSSKQIYRPLSQSACHIS
jgi:hypothetical protein